MASASVIAMDWRPLPLLSTPRSHVDVKSELSTISTLSPRPSQRYCRSTSCSGSSSIRNVVLQNSLCPSILDVRLRFSVSNLERKKMSRMTIRAGMTLDPGGENDNFQDYQVAPPVFPRAGVRDPFKLLGVSRDASDEEIWEARNYLSNQYSAHEKSREAIEAAYDKIIMGSFRDRKNSKINLKSKLKKKVAEAPPPIRALMNRFEAPTTQVIAQRAALFFLLGVWSVMNPAEGGPAFQVAVSLAACIYLLNARLKSLGRSFLIGFGALVVGWVSGSFLVPVLSSYIVPPSWNVELSTALFSYIFLWVACTFLK